LFAFAAALCNFYDKRSKIEVDGPRHQTVDRIYLVTQERKVVKMSNLVKIFMVTFDGLFYNLLDHPKLVTKYYSLWHMLVAVQFLVNASYDASKSSETKYVIIRERIQYLIKL